jgi:RNA polymerase sigma factor (sigma-70 family)
MANAALSKALHHFRRHMADGEEGDAQLLARFAAVQDEAAFTTLVRRHGPMVFATCQRVLGHVHDAEDAFQGTFLVLAKRAGSVARGEALGSWLHRVAYRVALEARAVKARRQARERPMNAVAHPEVQPAEPRDWQEVLDAELNRLPDKYRTVVVLCELEGRSRKQAAQSLGLAEGTLSSRLARARNMLAERLRRRGVTLSAAMPAATTAVPAALVESTVRGALLVGAGLEVTASASAVALMKGVLKNMFLTKLKASVSLLLVVAALGAGGLVYQVGRPAAAQADTPAAKPKNELERLRRENELLKLNLEVVLEKVKAQEAELRALKGQSAAVQQQLYLNRVDLATRMWERARLAGPDSVKRNAPTDPVKAVEDALRALRAAPNKEAQKKAAEKLEQATRQLQEHLKRGGSVVAPEK